MSQHGMNFGFTKVSKMLMVMETEAYEINKSKTGHPVHLIPIIGDE